MTHEPGPELDRLVGKAVSHDDTEGWWIVNGTWQTVPPFSRDWNAAMQPAEKCGLFGEPLYCGIYKVGTDWLVCNEDGEEISRHESGPTAICLAILKLKGIK